MQEPLKVGVGLRSSHFPYLENSPKTSLNWFECLSENYMNSNGRPLEILQQVRKDYEIACHGVGMNLGCATGVDKSYVQQLKNFIAKIRPFQISDHLCWTGTKASGNLHDLLPLPYTTEAVDLVSDNISYVQDYLKTQISIENVSTYLSYSHSIMTEWEFINEIQKRTGCGLLLDINNVYVNSFNHNFEAKTFIDRLNLNSVTQVHLAGHTDKGSYLFDTHDSEICEEVWHLFEYTASKMNHAPAILVEWDDKIPLFSDLEKQALIARNTWRKNYVH